MKFPSYRKASCDIIEFSMEVNFKIRSGNHKRQIVGSSLLDYGITRRRNKERTRMYDKPD